MLTLLGAGQGQNNSFDADYQAVLNRATALGYTLPSASQQIKQNNLVLALKAGGIWNKLDVLYIFANDGGSNFSTLNWKSPLNFQATLINTPTFTTNQGFTGNGTSSYINTNFIPLVNGVNYTLNNASRYLYLYTGGASSSLDGTDTSINNIQFSNSVAQRINSSNSLNSTFSFATGTPTKSIHRTSSTNVELFNGTVQSSKTQTSVALPATNQYILRNGTLYGDSKVSFYAIGASLVSENTAFVNAFNTYINSL